jgi:outer membrane protein assembly factor BamB/tRNA A-37 threonylcarbamoyl transferase component Bud32
MPQPGETKHIEGTDAARSLSVPDGTLQPGQVLQSRYRILGIIGMGGMGAVYQARDLHFANVTKLCAVKEMINLAQDQQLREHTIRNFEREAEILATLSHPAIPQIYDFFSFGDRAYLVLEYIQGRDLEALLNSTERFLPVEQIRQWGIEICDVLSYLHNHQPEPIIFRDMKPSNVIIDHHKRVRLIDFGIAKTFQIGQPGTMIGTEGYSPPEQYKGLASPTADIYALGATLHHLLTRRDPRLEPPFSFEQRSIPALNPDVSPEFAAVVVRALSYKAEDRYSSAEAMKQSLEALSSAMQAAPPAPRPALFVESAAPLPGASAQAAAPAPPPPRSQPQPSQMPAAPPLIQSSDNVLPIWSFKVEDAVRSRPVVHNNVLYVGAYDNNLWALDAKDGSLIWKFATEGGIGSSPAYGGGTVYIGSADYRLYAVDARTGKRKWFYKAESKIYTTPHLALGLVFFGSDDGKLYALKPGTANARESWIYNAMLPIRSSPVVDNDAIYFGTDGGEFFALDVSGELRWRFQTRRRIMSTPAVKDGLIYIGSDDWHLYALDVNQGYPVWRCRTKGQVISSPFIAEGRVYFGSADGFVYAVDALTGREVWKYNIGSNVTSSPFVYLDSLYVGAVDGALYCLHSRTGDFLWRFQSQGQILSSPTVAEDTVFVGSDDQHIYALHL